MRKAPTQAMEVMLRLFSLDLIISSTADLCIKNEIILHMTKLNVRLKINLSDIRISPDGSLIYGGAGAPVYSAELN